MSLLDQIERHKDEDDKLHQRLTDWEQAEKKLGSSSWTPIEKQECRVLLQEYPDFVPTVIDLARFGSVDALLSRYKAILSDLKAEGLLSDDDVEKSAEMAVSGRLSIGGVIREGKELKAWLDQGREAKTVHDVLIHAFHKSAQENADE